MIEEGRILTNHSALEKRFSGSKPMRIAIETGTHSPWISQMLEECGHDVLVFRSSPCAPYGGIMPAVEEVGQLEKRVGKKEHLWTSARRCSTTRSIRPS